MNYVLNEYLPHQKYFEDISRIPHGSHNEKELSDYLVKFAGDLGLKVKQDKLYNVIIYKPASEGYEDHPAIILQSHIDMVCEKNGDCDFDFEKDSLKLYIEDGFVRAKGTTLGADDGVGAALTMAVLADKTLKHPALECVFTVCEEVGLIGAQALDKNDFTSKRLINLDNSSSLSTYVSCSGGLRFRLKKKLEMVKCNSKAYRLEVRGLYGGHSGGNIHLERGNSNKICSRVLYHLNKEVGINLVNIDGGSKENAIPREATAIFASSGDVKKIKNIVAEQREKIKKELMYSDAGLTIEIYEDKAEKMCSKDISDSIITMFYMLPNGFKHRSMVIDGLTVASQNMGVIKTVDNEVICTYSLRGAIESYNDEGMEILVNFCNLFGFEWESGSRYPAWEYSENSVMREILKTVYKDFYDRDIQIKATHGGLECGVFKKIIPDIDIVTLGAESYDVHTPNERLNLESFDNTYKLLVQYLANL